MFKQPCRHKNPKPVTPAYTLLDTVYVTGASFHLCPLSLHPLSCGSWALDRTLLAAGTGSVDWNVRLLKSAWHHLLPVPPLQKYLKREHVKAEVSGCHEQQHISSSRWRFQKWYSSYFSTLSLFIKSGTLHIHQHLECKRAGFSQDGLIFISSRSNQQTLLQTLHRRTCIDTIKDHVLTADGCASVSTVDIGSM